MSDFWLYFFMPIVSAIVGWSTNVVALKMMFYPLEFLGKPPLLGWQGVVPRKAPKMAGITVDMLIPKMISVEALFANIDPKRVAQEMGPAVNQLVDKLVPEVMESTYPTLWETLPRLLKEEIFKRVRKDAPGVITKMMEDIQKSIDELLDIKALIVDSLVRDKQLMVDLFQRAGKEELKFIERSGIYFGYLFGLVQMGIWMIVQPWWLLPLGGVVVGYATNWLALKIIFSPIEPISLGRIKLQGLFLKRQKEVSAEYAHAMTEEILHIDNIMDAILRGPASDRLYMIVQKHIKDAVDEQAGLTKPFISLAIGVKGYIDMKNKIADHLFQELPHTMKAMHEYAQEAMNAETLLRNSLSGLSSKEFERVLHPIFEEDEWILIAVGAALGFCVGLFQFIVMFGGTIPV